MQSSQVTTFLIINSVTLRSVVVYWTTSWLNFALPCYQPAGFQSASASFANFKVLRSKGAAHYSVKYSWSDLHWCIWLCGECVSVWLKARECQWLLSGQTGVCQWSEQRGSLAKLLSGGCACTIQATVEPWINATLQNQNVPVMLLLYEPHRLKWELIKRVNKVKPCLTINRVTTHLVVIVQGTHNLFNVYQGVSIFYLWQQWTLKIQLVKRRNYG